jgi:hypothetical protein
MKTSVDPLKDAGFDHAFIAFLFCVLGWGLLEPSLLVMHAGPVLHIALPLPALCITGVSALRYRRYRKNAGHSCRPSAQGAQGFNVKNTGWALLLFSAGAALGMFILGESTILLGLVAMGMLFIPWSRVPFCAQRPATSCLITGVGSGAALAIGQDAISLMFLPVASWLLWACACVAVLRQVAQASMKDSPAAKVLAARHG